MQTDLPGMYIPADLETYIQLHLLTYYSIPSFITCHKKYYYTDDITKKHTCQPPEQKDHKMIMATGTNVYNLPHIIFRIPLRKCPQAFANAKLWGKTIVTF